MLGTFPNAFSHVATSQRYFPKWQLPNVIFPSGNFPMVFSQGTTSQRYFPKWKLPNVIFPCGNFPSLFSQVANSHRYFPKWKLPNGIFPSDNFPVQFPERQLPKSVLAAALGLLVSSSRSALPLTHPSRSASPPPIADCGAPEGLTLAWEVAAWEIETLEIVNWEVAHEKISFWECFYQIWSFSFY